MDKINCEWKWWYETPFDSGVKYVRLRWKEEKRKCEDIFCEHNNLIELDKCVRAWSQCGQGKKKWKDALSIG